MPQVCSCTPAPTRIWVPGKPVLRPTAVAAGTGFSSGSATRSQIKALVADGRFHRIGFQMAHGSTSQLPRIGGYGVQYCVQGVLIPICALQTTHSGFADALALAIAYCDERAAGLTE